MKFSELYRGFREADRDIETVESRFGCLCAIPEGGRILALAFSPEDESAFFLHPSLSDVWNKGIEPVSLVGGPGGDRIRFAPEYAFAWDGENRDTRHFSNYRQQLNEEPGTYSLQLSGDTLIHTMETSLLNRIEDKEINFSIIRRVTPAAPPLELPQNVGYAGYESSSCLTLASPDEEGGGTIGMWFLLQVEAGSTLLVPLKMRQTPLPYFNKGDWTLAPDALFWDFKGEANAKIGYGTAIITGRTAVVTFLENSAVRLLIRQFPVRDEMYYCDGLSRDEAGDQVFQAWDGFGFGEMEYHSPATGGGKLPAVVQDVSQLWAFEGTKQAISEIAEALLGIKWKG